MAEPKSKPKQEKFREAMQKLWSYENLEEEDEVLEYFWQDDIEGILRYIDGMTGSDFAIRKEEISREYSLFEFGIMLNEEG